jgi:hypothetical protein
MPRTLPITALLLAALTLPACGSSTDDSGDRPAAAKERQRLNGADRPGAGQFPAANGSDTLQEVADRVGATGPQVVLAGTVFTPGHNRLAFGVIDPKAGFVYGPTAVYVAPSPTAPARGPFLAPADLLITEAPFRSKQAATESDPFAAVYEAQVDFTKTGSWSVLAVTKVGSQLVAAGVQLRVRRDSPIPAVGEAPPAIVTDTRASAGGNLASIDTRLPPSDMHDKAFRSVLGRKPVVLLFATPQLCQSRVCGPVVDIALQMKAKYGDRMEFIHQEVYKGNSASNGLRSPLLAFRLQTEPWLFTFGRDGKVAARLEGSFGLNAFERAVKAAL